MTTALRLLADDVLDKTPLILSRTSSPTLCAQWYRDRDSSSSVPSVQPPPAFCTAVLPYCLEEPNGPAVAWELNGPAVVLREPKGGSVLWGLYCGMDVLPVGGPTGSLIVLPLAWWPARQYGTHQQRMYNTCWEVWTGTFHSPHAATGRGSASLASLR